MELLIWAGGRWRRVCPVTGRVTGWRRRARIVVNRQGALHELPVAALRSVVKGPRLPKERIREVPDSKPNNRYGQTKPPWQPTKQKDACIQTVTEPIQTTTAPKTIPETAKLQHDKENQVPSQPERRFRSVSTEIIPIKPSKQHNYEKNKAENAEKQNYQKGDTVKIVNHTTTDTQESSESSEEVPCKELIIDEGDVLLFRRYIASHGTDIDLYRFDADDNYKVSIFYQFHPIIRIERSSRIAQMINDHDFHVTIHFARQLGLRSVDEIEQNQQRRTRHRAVKQATAYFAKRRQMKVKKTIPEEVLISSDDKEEEITKKKAKSTVIRSDVDSDSYKQEYKRIKSRSAKSHPFYIDLSSDESFAEIRKVKKNRRAPTKLASSSDEDEISNKKSRVTRTNVDSDSDVQVQLRSNKRRHVKEVTNDDNDEEKPRKIRKTTAKVAKTQLTKENENDEEPNGRNNEKSKVASQTTAEKTQLTKENDNDKEPNGRNNRNSKVASQITTEINTDNKQSNKKNKKQGKSKEASQTTAEKTQLTKENDMDEEPNGRNNRTSKVASEITTESNTSNKESNKKDEKQDSESSDKEFKAKKLRTVLNTKRNPSKDGDQKNDSDEENQRPKDTKKSAFPKRLVVPKRSSVPPGREYSMLEDQAIVAWLSASTGRERAVNGNRIWRDLQETYPRLTGQKRSWHSLRNRYLRYILPSLGALMLPPHLVQRLRAHASLGELKSKKKFRRNSVFNLPAVRSAARARPRTAPSPRSGTSTPPSPKRRVLRSSTHTSQTPSASTRSHSPTKPHTHSPTKPHTQLTHSPTRRRHSQSPSKRKTPSKAHVDASKSAVNTGRTRSPHKATDRTGSPHKSRERRTKSPRSSPSYTEVSRRFALRNRSTPQQSQPTVAPHKRRLYNPQRPASAGSPHT